MRCLSRGVIWGLVSGASGLMVLVGSSIAAASPVVILSWLKVGVIAAKALNSVFNNESIESLLVLDPPVNESIAAVDESALGKIPELGMEKNAGQSDTQLMLTLRCREAPAVRALDLTESQCQAVGSIAGGAAKHDPLRVKS